MDPKLVLCSFASVLLLMNAQGNYARDMKIEGGGKQEEAKQPYLDGWYKNTHEKGKTSNHPILDGWYKETDQDKEKASHDSKSNPTYPDGWLKDTKDVKQLSTQDSHQPYLDGWYKEEKVTHNSNQLYLDGWLKNTQLGNNEKTSQNLNQPYLDGWYKNIDNSIIKNSILKSSQPYLDGWVKNTELGDSNTRQSSSSESSKVDHTEAFKAAFFTLDDLYVGNVMTLQFPVREYGRFFSRKQADSLPFSSTQLPSLLQLLSLTKDSPQGQEMKELLEQCEFGPMKGETKACPTSLESMLEFVESILGAEVRYNILTTSYPTTSSARLQNYTILKISEDIYAPKWVACHPRPYPYAVYYCHYLDIGSKVFKVLLDGQFGDKMDALAICHLDTSEMNPTHILFQQLGIKPGEAPICHFFPVKHLLWVPQATM